MCGGQSSIYLSEFSMIFFIYWDCDMVHAEIEARGPGRRDDVTINEIKVE